MEGLCEELLFHIFSFSDEQSRATSSMVCRTWRRILSDETLQVWNIYGEWKRTRSAYTAFLEACKRGDVLGVKYIASKVTNEIFSNKLNIPDGIHGVWNQGLLIAVQNDRPEIIRLMSSYGVTDGTDALRKACQLKLLNSIRAIIEEFRNF